MISGKFHTLYRINKGGIKTDCVEFVEFENSDNLQVSVYKLTAAGDRSALLPNGKPQLINRETARAYYKCVKEAGYQSVS